MTTEPPPTKDEIEARMMLAQAIDLLREARGNLQKRPDWKARADRLIAAWKEWA